MAKVVRMHPKRVSSFKFAIIKSSKIVKVALYRWLGLDSDAGSGILT